jgi:transposase
METLSMKSDAIRQLFYERHLAGASYRDIAKELGISLRTASNWAQEMKLPRRRGGPRRQKWMPSKKPKIG